MSILYVIFNKSPIFLQNIAVSLVNFNSYRIRRSDAYENFRDYYSKWDSAKKIDVESEHIRRLDLFLEKSIRKSEWYKEKGLSGICGIEKLKSMPVLEKIDIINNLDFLKTINDKDGLISLTGGTTGASMKVVYTKNDIQERFAILDNFRAKHGYELGKKTAWFSGKNLITEKNIEKGICSNYDFINKIRFYSTFHINKKSFDTYWNSLNDFKPEFVVGFPSSVYELCEIADSKGLRVNHKVKVFFPTAETVLPHHREVIGRVLGCRIVDQYASSEGAPFILECEKGNLHIHPLTGVFEVINENMQPAMEGELLVTSFTTNGTPLIRYRIGDRIKLAPKNQECSCGSIFQIVDKIEGRSTDYILSPTHGKINLGNISNSTKNIDGIIQFQIIQKNISEVEVLVLCTNKFNDTEQYKFKKALIERLGSKLDIDIKIVSDIPREKSGKFRIVKNLLNT